MINNEPFVTAANLVDATNNTDVFSDVSGSLRTTALALIKIANEFRLMASGPRCGLNKLDLPACQTGLSIMHGKVNLVIPEVLNQTCYQVIGNDLAVTMGVENGQLELNVMETVMALNIFNSITYLTNAVNTFNKLCVQGVNAKKEQCETWLEGSVGIITALLPHIGYENSSMLTKEAMEIILSTGEMIQPGIAGKELVIICSA